MCFECRDGQEPEEYVFENELGFNAQVPRNGDPAFVPIPEDESYGSEEHLYTDPSGEIEDVTERATYDEWLYLDLLRLVPEREQNIVMLFNGFFGDRMFNGTEIASMYGMTPTAIYRIRDRAYRRMRHGAPAMIRENPAFGDLTVMPPRSKPSIR